MSRIETRLEILDPAHADRACWLPQDRQQGRAGQVPTADQRQAFAKVLRRALEESHMSGRAFARSLDLSQGGIAHWLRGETAPKPATVARVERLLELEPGTLARPLGYAVVTEDPEGRAVNVTEAIKAEQRLGAREKALLLTIYRELLRQYGTTDAAKE
jgi:transcriptional regulator with XRE-family HTH domain